MDWARSHGAASGCYPTRLTSVKATSARKWRPGSLPLMWLIGPSKAMGLTSHNLTGGHPGARRCSTGLACAECNC